VPCGHGYDFGAGAAEGAAGVEVGEWAADGADLVDVAVAAVGEEFGVLALVMPRLMAGRMRSPGWRPGTPPWK
jgi:hypothetical protein